MNKQLKLSLLGILLVSGVAFGFLIWLIYFKEKPQVYSVVVGYLPALNALLNGLSVMCLIKGLLAIKNKDKLGSKILEKIYEYALHNDIKNITLECDKSVIKFYEKHGFIETGKLENNMFSMIKTL